MVTIEEQLADLAIPAPKLPRNPRSIPIFGRDAASRIETIAEKYKFRGDPRSLGVALAEIYFNHRQLWLPHSRDSKARQRAAAKINFATKRYMTLLSRNVKTFAHLLTAAAVSRDDAPLSIGDISTLTVLLRRVLLNSAVAKRGKSARGRGKDRLAVTVSAELGQIYEQLGPPKSRPIRGGESRGNIKARFVCEAAGMLGVRLAQESARTYREKKHTLRVRS